MLFPPHKTLSDCGVGDWGFIAIAIQLSLTASVLYPQAISSQETNALYKHNTMA